ncbi:hypothetical protein [Oleidesulfovibrio sp.]|uniref:hypothetical protein n=1 Tax=Oleidesulfovibrio sp. TaxID=2909707 RepID=UPI003A87CD30
MPSAPTLLTESIPAMLQNLSIGLRTLSGELRWLVRSTVHAHEVRQVEKRIAQELVLLGRTSEEAIRAAKSVTTSKDSPASIEITPEIDLAFRQVDFLRDEIKRLEQELQEQRTRFIEKQRSSLEENSAE